MTVKTLPLLATLGGVLAALVGATAGVVWLIQIVMIAPRADTSQIVATFVLAALGLGVGLPLALAGLRAWMGLPGRPPGSLPVWIWVPATLVVIGLGAAVVAAGVNLPLLLPPLHFLAIALPVAGAVSLATRRLTRAGLSGRFLLGHLASGAFIATSLALGLELVIGALAGGTAAVLIAVFVPGGREHLRQIIDLLSQIAAGGNLNPDRLVSLLTWLPFVVVGLILVCGLFPLLEEAIKPISAFVLIGAVSTPGAAFLSGLAAGAGFGLTEGLLNGAMSLDDWTATMLLRAGGTAMHAFASGLVAWGWYQAWRMRRPWQGLFGYVAAVVLHGTWNLLALGVAFATIGNASISTRFTGGAMAITLLGMLAALSLVAYLGIVVISRRLQPPSALNEAIH